MPSSDPRLSVAIITRQEAAYIEGCLDAVALAATAAGTEVEAVIADAASPDGTAAIARRWGTSAGSAVLVRTVDCPRPGYAAQRNAAVAAARAPWVAFISADVRVPAGWIVELDAQLDGSWDLALGEFDWGTPVGRAAWMEGLAPSVYAPSSAMPLVEGCSSVHLIARRAALDRTPFSEHIGACEDKELAFRMLVDGAAVARLAAGSVPVHIARESPRQFLRKLANESRWLTVLSRRHGSAWPDCFGWRSSFRRWTLLSCLTVGLAGAAVLAGIPVFILPAMGLGTVLLAAFSSRRWRLRKRGAAPAPTLAVMYVLAMLAVAMGRIRGLAARD